MANEVGVKNDILLMTTEEMAAGLRISTASLQKLYRSKQVPVIKLGHRTIRFNPDEVIKSLSK